MPANIMMNRYIYVASSPIYREFPAYKIGCTKNLYSRLHKSRTWSLARCKRHATDGQEELEFDISYDRVFLTNAVMHGDMLLIERAFHTHFAQYRAKRERIDDSEWFDFEDARKCGYDPLREIDAFAASLPSIERALDAAEIARACACSQAGTRAHSTSDPPRMQLTPFIVRARTDEHASDPITLHTRALIAAQKPIISQIREFLEDDSRDAGYVIAPCGSGKTVMTCDAMREFMQSRAIDTERTTHTNVIVCVPVECIQAQWHRTLVERRVFARDDVYMINGSQTGMSASECADRYVRACARMHECTHAHSPICAIVTYASSHLLTQHIEAYHASLMIFDEAHHLAGIVAQQYEHGAEIEDEEESECMHLGRGRTRVLAAVAAKLGIKRIALTYTPRIARVHERDIISGRKVEFLTMDDKAVFGKQIARLDLRKLINDGILPDYRICAIRSHPSCARTEALANDRSAQVGECILRAWVEYARDINHLIIFARTLNDVRELGAYLREHATDTLVICISSEDNVRECITRFAGASRAMLVNCYKLSEGVDIPCADSVAIAYAKESRGQITQMILRAGRWHPNKAMFRVLIPIIDDCSRDSGTTGMSIRPMNTTALTEVLVAMAINDSLIRDELKLRAQEQMTPCASSASVCGDTRTMNSPNDRIDLFCFASTDLERIRQIIASSYVFVSAQGNSVDIREICAAHNIRTSIDYARMRARLFPDLPEHPWKQSCQTPYAFLNAYVHTHARALPSITDFLANIRMLGFMCVEHYVAGLQAARESRARDGTVAEQSGAWCGSIPLADYPEAQNILDGCFGPMYDDFTKIFRSSIRATMERRRTRKSLA